MLKIKESEGESCVIDNYYYLNFLDTTVYKRISFKDFSKNFKFYEYEEKELMGDNLCWEPDTKRYWLENEKMFVEITVYEGEKTKFSICKVITDGYENSKDLIKDLLDLGELYDAIVRAFKDYIDNIKIDIKE